MLLDIFLLEKAVYKIGYDPNNRPDSLKVPFKGLLDFMSTKTGRLDPEGIGFVQNTRGGWTL